MLSNAQGNKVLVAKGFVALRNHGIGEDTIREYFAIAKQRGMYSDNTIDTTNRGKGNAVSRRLGYEVKQFHCECEHSPCQHEMSQGNYYYETPSEYQLPWWLKTERGFRPLW